ncbi:MULTISPECIES: hypothetical protein [unclassified Microcoleus]|uniref:hypothetical protein n=1 Tax=unclassified Microcoleus TaxID=2642155 RepID=UPI002FD4D7A6
MDRGDLVPNFLGWQLGALFLQASLTGDRNYKPVVLNAKMVGCTTYTDNVGTAHPRHRRSA